MVKISRGNLLNKRLNPEEGENQMHYNKNLCAYQARGLAVRFNMRAVEYRGFCLSSALLIPCTCDTPPTSNFILLDTISCHVLELSRITGTVLDISSISYRDSIAQELSSHLQNTCFRYWNTKTLVVRGDYRETDEVKKQEPLFWSCIALEDPLCVMYWAQAHSWGHHKYSTKKHASSTISRLVAWPSAF